MEAADVVVGLVREAVASVPSVAVYDGELPQEGSRPRRYVVVNISPGLREAGNVAERSDRERLYWQVSSFAVADDPAAVRDIAWQARWAARRIRDYLVERKIAPSGSKIRHVLSTTSGDPDLVAAQTTAVVVDQYEALA